MLLDLVFKTVETQPTLAIAPLIWLLGAVAILVIEGAILIICSDTEKVEGKSIAVLGMEKSGKTTLLCHMRRIPYHRENEDFPEFTYKLNGRELVIKEGRDIDGGDAWMETYKDRISKSDIVFFVFDAKKYLEDVYYLIETNGRLSFIKEEMKEKHWAILGTHLDAMNSDEEKQSSIIDIQKKVSDKPYKELFLKNFIVLNMTEGKAIDDFLNKVI